MNVSSPFRQMLRLNQVSALCSKQSFLEFNFKSALRAIRSFNLNV